MLAIQPICHQIQSPLASLPEEVLTAQLYSVASYTHAVGLINTCKKMYILYFQYLACDPKKTGKFLSFFISKERQEGLSWALSHFSPGIDPITIDIDLITVDLEGKNKLKECLEKIIEKFSISCITLSANMWWKQVPKPDDGLVDKAVYLF